MVVKLKMFADTWVPENLLGSKTTTVPGGPEGANSRSLPSEPLLKV